jgi:hypothetical protein
LHRLVAGRVGSTKDKTMTTALRWIGSLSSVLQAGLDRAVSAELHAITSGICRSRTIAKPAAAAAADVSGCGSVGAAGLSGSVARRADLAA